MRFIRISALLLIFSILTSSAIAQTIYEVSFPNPNTHYINVDIHFNGLPPDSFDVKMPVWIPGSYMVREFSRNVEGFNAYDIKNRDVKFRKVRKNTWRVYNDTSKALSVRYRVYAFELSVRTSFVDIDQAFINGPSVYMYTESLKNKPVLVNIKPWREWNNVSTGLEKFGAVKWSFTATDYDQLVDCPMAIGNHDIFSFDYNGIPHHIAMIGKANYDKEKLKADFYKIVDACTQIFKENPNREYTFFIHNSFANGGGLEHSNSCSIITARGNYEAEKSYHNFLSYVSHEYLHLWNVKRIRPVELGPFDYDNEVYTQQLWFFEGATSFYDDYILYKLGIYSEAEYFELIKGNIQTVMNTPGDSIQSLAESSFDAWIKYYRQNENSRNSTISYYTKGGILAMIMNLDIIAATNGTKSFDDVFHYLYHEHYKKLNRGLTDVELQKAFEIVAGKSYKEFFEKYIYGKERLPVEEYFLKAGIQLIRNDGMKQANGFLGATFSQSGSKLLVSFVERGTAAWDQGLNVNDEILDVDGKEPMQVKDYLASKLPGETVTFKIIRAGLQREFSIMLGEPVTMEFEISELKKPTAEQQMIRSKWLKVQN